METAKEMNELREIILKACVEHGMPAVREIVNQAIKDAQRKASYECGHKYVQNQPSDDVTFCYKCGWYV